MTTGYEDNSQFCEGVETVQYKAKDSDATALSIINALCGKLSRSQLALWATLGVQGRSLAIQLDGEELGEVIPVRRGLIGRTHGATTMWWRIQSTDFDHVIGVWECLCSEVL